MSNQYDDFYNELMSGGGDTSQRPDTSGMSLGQVGRSAITNLLPSAGRVIKDTALGLVNVLNPNPDKNTVVGLGRAVSGAMQSLPGPLGSVARRGQAAILGQGEADKELQVFQGMADYFKNRYGSVDALKQTIAEDPAGFALDLSTVIDPALAGTKVGLEAAGATRAAGVVGKTAEAARGLNPLEAAGRVTGKAGELVKAGVEKVTGADGVVGWGTKQFDKATADVFAANGVRPLAGMVTRNRAVQNIYAFASKYLFGGKLDDRIDMLGARINAHAEAIANSVRDTNLNFTSTSLGETISKRYTNYLDAFRKESETVYAPIVAATADEAAMVTTTGEALGQILARKRQVIGGDPTIGAFQKISNDLGKKPPTIGELRATRTYVGEQMSRSGADSGWSQLYASLSQDLTESVRKVSPELADKLAAADASYQQGMSMIQDGIGRSITMSSSPEAIVQNVIRPNKPTYIRQLRQVVGDDTMEMVGTSVLKDIADKASKEVSVPSLEGAGATERLTVVDPQKFLKAVDSWPDETLRAALTDEQYSRLKAASEQMRGVDVMKQATGRMGRTISGSQTAFSVGNARAILGGSSAMASLMTGNAIPVVTFLGSLAGESVLTRFLDSPMGYKFFTTGYKPGIADQYMKWLEGAGKAATSPAPAQIQRTTQPND